MVSEEQNNVWVLELLGKKNLQELDRVHLAYEVYKASWVLSHIGKQKAQSSYMNYLADKQGYDNYEDYLYEFGFDGELFACFDEFVACELAEFDNVA